MPRRAAAAAPRRRGAADERIYRDLSGAIVDHRIPPGTSLPEDTLAAAFGVSRTVIRKALLRLGHERLVDLRPNRGAMVARPSVEEAKSVFATRRIVEAAVIDAAVAQAAAAELAELRHGLAAEEAAERAGDRRTLIRLSGDFHRRLAALARNPVLADFVGELVARSSLILALYQRHAAPRCSHDEHMAVLEAVIARDGSRARKLMDAHLTQIEEQLDLNGGAPPIDLHALFSAARRQPEGVRA